MLQRGVRGGMGSSGFCLYYKFKMSPSAVTKGGVGFSSQAPLWSRKTGKNMKYKRLVVGVVESWPKAREAPSSEHRGHWGKGLAPGVCREPPVLPFRKKRLLCLWDHPQLPGPR